MNEIPVIDLAPVLAGADPTRVVDELRYALTEVGFFQVVGHGLDRALLEAAYESMAQIAALPDADRRALMRPRAQSRGLHDEIDQEGRVLHRSLQFITYDDLAAAQADDAVGGHPDYFVPNVWPEMLPGFRIAWKQYGLAARGLARQLMSLFARTLDLPPDFFEEPFAKDVTLFSVNLYPPQPVDEDYYEDVILNPHADSGGLTVLHQRGDYEGLQVRGRDGGWSTVPFYDDAFVINIGHLLSRWTNGRYPAVVHRVMAGPTTANQRQSIAMFFLPNLDQVVSPVATTVGAEGPRFDPISTYDWQLQFMKEYVLIRSYAEPAGA
jgi:isopenicillin N synthase-like dioxygenase